MSNALVGRNGQPWTNPLFGNNGAIKTVNVINSLPKTVAEFSKKHLQDVDVNRIKSFANRDTKITSIKKIINARGGIDGSIVRLPRGATIRGDHDKTVWVYDGDHTRHIWLALNPTEETMPMHVIQVGSMKEVNELFINNNKTGKTKITAEQEFVNNYHAAKPDTIKQADFAQNANLFVYCSHESSGRAGSTSGLEVKVNTLKKLISACPPGDAQPAKEAVELVSQMSEFDSTKPVHLHLTCGLTMLNVCYPTLMKNAKSMFAAWYKGYTNNHKLNDVVTLAQSQCGQSAIGSQHTYYVAMGLLKILKLQKIEGLNKFRTSTLEKKFSPN